MTERTYTADEVDAMIARALAREREQPAQPSQSRSDVKPLTDEALEAVIGDWSCLSWGDRIGEVRRIARAIEAAHGIKGDA